MVISEVPHINRDCAYYQLLSMLFLNLAGCGGVLARDPRLAIEALTGSLG